MRFYVFVFLFAALFASTASGNGINPPKTKGAQTSSALCASQTSGETTTLNRARVVAKSTTGSVEARFESSKRTIQLAEISSIEIKGTADSHGYGKATFEMRKSGDSQEGSIRLTYSGKPVLLTGFSDSGSRLEVPLASCRKLDFLAAGSSSSQPGTSVKKK